MVTVVDLMEDTLLAKAEVAEVVAEFMKVWRAPVEQAERVKMMLAQGRPGPDATESDIALARRLARMGRGEANHVR